MKTKSNPKKKYNIKKDKATDKSSKQEYYCPLCREKYEDTAEVCTECTICKYWWHEACTSYESGIFTCDLCAMG
ncbi:unnamed protein product [Acanthoscelides obtectus]|uniref:Zinc finger PHD-type domain-containing protein n=1 Tax=Acanthoscelides obtectus TaxID=200917 RepID=A0A9P0PCQ6_ACAOB|nr:unnamed protein product [Acanthoscelides obtectus]CAK1653686.1 hypothetical protein AOBTE_LOCUS18327 [Acanthoscelides obtectus]